VVQLSLLSDTLREIKNLNPPHFGEEHMLGSVLYSAFNGQLWHWKSKGLVDSVLVNPFPHMSHRHIADILGYDDIQQMTEEWKDESTETLKRLCGPHGYTLYKVLVIKWEDKVNHKEEAE
jgi:hypothetical protein